jgi:hypothetical protein
VGELEHRPGGVGRAQPVGQPRRDGQVRPASPAARRGAGRRTASAPVSRHPQVDPPLYAWATGHLQLPSRSAWPAPDQEQVPAGAGVALAAQPASA